MTKSEIIAFNSGVLTVLDLAKSSSATMEALAVLKPTRFNFAAEALRALAEEGRALLKPDGLDGVAAVPNPSPAPGLSGGAVRLSPLSRVAPAHAGDDGNFGLTEAEIAHPSRATIIGWLSGRTPMLASHWSRVAAGMLKDDAAVAAHEATE